MIGKLERKLREQWKSEQHCDVTLKVKDKSVKAHKCVLTASSKFFDKMFSRDFKEKEEKVIDLGIMFETVEELKTLLSWLYGCDVDVNEDNVEDLLNGSDILDVSELLDECVCFLIKNLNIQNCLMIWALAEKHSLTEVVKLCQDVTTQRFADTILILDEALSVPPEFLTKLLKKGVAKYCKFDKMKTFLSKYTAQEKWKDSCNEDKLFSVYSKYKVKEPKLQMLARNHTEDREECVWVEIPDTGKWYLYRPATDQWLTVPKSCDVLGTKWRLDIIGVGPGNQYGVILSESQQRYQLLHLPSLKIIKPGTLPTVMLEACWMHAYGEDLYAVICEFKRTQPKGKTSESKKKSGNWMDNLKGMYDAARVKYFVYIQKYDWVANKWKQVKSVIQSDEPVLRIRCSQQLNGNISIVAFQERQVSLFNFCVKEEKLETMDALKDYKYPSDDIEEGSYMIRICSSHERLVIIQTDGRIVHEFNFKSKKWSKQAPMALMPTDEAAKDDFQYVKHSYVTNSFCQSDIRSYFVLLSEFGWYTLFTFSLPDKEYDRLAPLPFQHLSVEEITTENFPRPHATLVHKRAFDLLTPVSLDDTKQNRLHSEVTNCKISNYKERIRRQNKETNNNRF